VHVSPAGHVPQLSVLPQPSGTDPHIAFADAHVTDGVQPASVPVATH
jgi:hypothetical protein